ncbi:hypothetical protein H4582DRAFT_2130350 [Lactarius indigo]|nr:hypothetical protein H4582DRAFT_2130350 [Lactarius indigo]
MSLVDTLGFCISVFGVVIYLRFLLPHNIIPTISSMLTDAEQSLALAITIGAVPEMSDHKVGIAVLYSLASRNCGNRPFLTRDSANCQSPSASPVTAGDTPADITDPTPPLPVTVTVN